ncbi:MAG: ABC transporter permease [Clostridia bacterium]|nr:ABC transporter permease [Clostridia bacterium]
MRQILNIAFYETLHIFRNRILTLMVLVVPLFYAAVIGLAYVEGIFDSIPIGIVDLDHSGLSRELVENFKNSPQFSVREGVENFGELERQVKEGRLKAGVVIPENFERDVTNSRGTEVLVAYDASNLISAYNIRKNALQVINTLNARCAASYLAGTGMTEGEIKSTLDAVSYEYQIWYNPTLNYAVFIFPGILMMIIHQIGMYTAALSVTREKSNNSWVQFLSSPVPPWKIYIGKTLPYCISNLFNYALLLWFSSEFMNINIKGSTYLLVLLGILFVIIVTSIGFFISVHAKTSLQVTRYMLLLSVPLFMISGFTWPKAYMANWVRTFADVLPYTWMAEGIRLAAIKGLGMEFLGKTLKVLSLMAIISVILGAVFTKREKSGSSPKMERI